MTKIYIPPPAIWQDFQSLVKEVYSVRYHPCDAQEYGCVGQKQNGVDVYVVTDDGKRIGIQCKETKKKLALGAVIEEADKALQFTPSLTNFIMATTSGRDAVLQSGVFEINQQKKYPFSVKVEAWDELMDYINRYQTILDRCCLGYAERFKKDDEANHLACLRIAFDRPAFKDMIFQERSFGDFEEALVSTKRFFRTGFVMDRWTGMPVVQTIPLDLLPNTYRLRISKIESSLEALYSAFLDNKRQIINHSLRDAERERIEGVRAALMGDLNRILMEAEMEPIRFVSRRHQGGDEES